MSEDDSRISVWPTAESAALRRRSAGFKLEWVARSWAHRWARRLQASLRGCNAERRRSAGLLRDRTHPV